MNTTNLLLAGVIICQISSLFFALIVAKRLISWARDNALSFFQSPEEGKPPPSLTIVDLIAGRFGSAIVASIKGFLMAENSAAIRQDKAAARADMMGNPLMGIAAKYAPGLVRKNPELVQMAMQYFSGRKGGNDNDNGQREVSTTDPFKI